MSSARTDAGSSTSSQAALELGRQLATRFDDNDIVRRWMAHHLAELVALAEDDSTTTVEQRQQIIDLILKVWAYRRYYSGADLLDGYPSVFAALDRLGEETPWRFLQLFDGDDLLDRDEASPPLLGNAVELTRLTRDAVIGLLWLAAKDANEKNSALLEVADRVSLTIESRVTRQLRQLRRRTVSTRWALNGDGEDTDVEDVISEPSVDGEDVVDDQMIKNDLAGRLRRAASDLTRIADEIAPEGVSGS